jgi:hypothetical protein
MNAITGGLLALKGLSLLTDLVRSARDSQRTPNPSVTEAQFEQLLGRMMSAGGDSAATKESRRALSPILFRQLDHDGNGLLEGRELTALDRMLSQVHREERPQAWAELSEEKSDLIASS